MAKYIAVFNCPLCGERLAPGSPAEIPPDKLPSLLGRVVANQQFLGTSLNNTPMHLPHKCKDGNAGLAYFAGFVKIG